MGRSRGRAGDSGHQEEALHVVSSNSVNVAQHRAIQDTSDPLPLLLQPWQNQSFNHLLERKGKSQGPGVTTESPRWWAIAHYDFMVPPSQVLPHWGLTSCPSSARPAMEP